MRLSPDAESSHFSEFNHCHDKAGRFDMEGRCGADAKDMRADFIKTFPQKDEKARKGWLKQRAQAKRDILQGRLSYMNDDARRAFSRDRAVTSVNPGLRSSASSMSRAVVIDPSQVMRLDNFGKPEVLSALRHEIGHVMPDPLHTARTVGLDPAQMVDSITNHAMARMEKDNVTLSSGNTMFSAEQIDEARLEKRDVAYTKVARILEEVRAWRNGIKSGHGKVSWPAVRWSLGSYINNFLGPEEGPKALDTAITHLQRYARVVKRDYVQKFQTMGKTARASHGIVLESPTVDRARLKKAARALGDRA